MATATMSVLCQTVAVWEATAVKAAVTVAPRHTDVQSTRASELKSKREVRNVVLRDERGPRSSFAAGDRNIRAHALIHAHIYKIARALVNIYTRALAHVHGERKRSSSRHAPSVSGVDRLGMRY